MRAVRAFVIGAGAAYFLDPERGRRRRHVLRDRFGKVARKSSRAGIRKAKRVEGHARGYVAGARRLVRSTESTADDAKVIQRIRSDAFREAGVSTKDVDVEVEDGVATLEGELPSDELAEALVSKVASTPGVRDVAAVLRVARTAAVR
jgi:osmotically-inducible protein OsmY